jgi:uncharacterized protein (TIGR00730 family)
VFCGSRSGGDAVYARAAQELGRTLAARGIRMIYGGGGVGLMGAIAGAAMSAGAEVIGVIPHGLQRKELAYHKLTELHVVETMHERKQMMADLSDGFIAMPGGFGTFEEFCEIITWAQLGLHAKPCGLLNVNRYYANMLAMFDHGVAEQFISPLHRELILTAEQPAQLLDAMESYSAPPIERWLTSRTT